MAKPVDKRLWRRQSATRMIVEEVLPETQTFHPKGGPVAKYLDLLYIMVENETSLGSIARKFLLVMVKEIFPDPASPYREICEYHIEDMLWSQRNVLQADICKARLILYLCGIEPRLLYGASRWHPERLAFDASHLLEIFWGQQAASGKPLDKSDIDYVELLTFLLVKARELDEHMQQAAKKEQVAKQKPRLIDLKKMATKVGEVAWRLAGSCFKTVLSRCAKGAVQMGPMLAKLKRRRSGPQRKKAVTFQEGP